MTTISSCRIISRYSLEESMTPMSIYTWCEVKPRSRDGVIPPVPAVLGPAGWIPNQEFDAELLRERNYIPATTLDPKVALARNRRLDPGPAGASVIRRVSPSSRRIGTSGFALSTRVLGFSASPKSRGRTAITERTSGSNREAPCVDRDDLPRRGAVSRRGDRRASSSRISSTGSCCWSTTAPPIEAARSRRSYGATDERIRVLEHPRHENRGMAASRSLALTHARGEVDELPRRRRRLVPAHARPTDRTSRSTRGCSHDLCLEPLVA